MATTSAPTVAEYLKEQPAQRRAVVAAVREVVRRNLPPRYRESRGRLHRPTRDEAEALTD